MWGIPKGHKQPDEYPQPDFINNQVSIRKGNIHCWKRELAEETGMRVIPKYRFINEFVVLKYGITIARLSNQDLPEVAPGDKEIRDVKWVPFNKLWKYKLNAISKKALAHFRKPFMREEG